MAARRGRWKDSSRKAVTAGSTTAQFPAWTSPGRLALRRAKARSECVWASFLGTAECSAANEAWSVQWESPGRHSSVVLATDPGSLLSTALPAAENYPPFLTAGCRRRATAPRESPYDAIGRLVAPFFPCRGLSARPGTMVAARSATARLEKTFPGFRGSRCART